MNLMNGIFEVIKPICELQLGISSHLGMLPATSRVHSTIIDDNDDERPAPVTLIS